MAAVAAALGIHGLGIVRPHRAGLDSGTVPATSQQACRPAGGQGQHRATVRAAQTVRERGDAKSLQQSAYQDETRHCSILLKLVPEASGKVHLVFCKSGRTHDRS
jgi:hypothetical protein